MYKLVVVNAAICCLSLGATTAEQLEGTSHTHTHTHLTALAHHHSVFTGRMPFLPPNQQRQSTEGTEGTSPRVDIDPLPFPHPPLPRLPLLLHPCFTHSLPYSLFPSPIKFSKEVCGPIYKISYDNLTIMPKLRSTYDGRLIYKTSYEGREVFLRYYSLAKL